jgi:hypothetical protein
LEIPVSAQQTNSQEFSTFFDSKGIGQKYILEKSHPEF